MPLHLFIAIPGLVLGLALATLAPGHAENGPAPLQGAAAQKALLYEESPGNSGDTPVVGAVVWRTEQAVSDGHAPETVIRGVVVIPDRNISVTVSLRRNVDN